MSFGRRAILSGALAGLVHIIPTAADDDVMGRRLAHVQVALQWTRVCDLTFDNEVADKYLKGISLNKMFNGLDDSMKVIVLITTQMDFSSIMTGDFCSVAMRGYGPDGEDIPGLLKGSGKARP